MLTGAVVAASRTSPARVLPLEPLAAVSDDHGDAAALARLLGGSSLAALQAHLDAGDVTSEQLTRYALAQMLRTDAALNAVIELNPAAVADARAADARRSAGDRSPLLGVPVTVKDNIETAGPLRTTAGAEVLAGHVADHDAAVVTALRSAGAVVLGTANLSELAGAAVRTPGFSATGGQTANPYGASFSPGGSSSGSAVCVAAGLVPVSVGTETSGSLLAPAAFTGVVGIKPTHGLVDGGGIVPLVRYQDTAGPLARTVADAAALLSVLSQGRLSVDLSGATLDGVRVGVLREAILAQRPGLEKTGDNAEMLGRIDHGLAAAGAVAVDAALVIDGSLDAFEASFLTVVLGGLTHDTVGYLARAGAPVESLADLHAYNLQRPRRRMPKGQLLLSLALARQISRDAYETSALDLRRSAQRTLDATTEAAGVEVLVSITNLHSSLYATAGYPAVCVPLGLRANGMPTGVTLIGRPGEDAALLRTAAAFEAATRLRRPPAAAP